MVSLSIVMRKFLFLPMIRFSISLAIDSVLADNPKVLILDEPTVGLDAKSVSSLVRILNLIKSRYEKTIIVFSKDADFIHQIADEVVIINNGKIVLSGNKLIINTGNSTITHETSLGVKTNAAIYYNHEYPKIKLGKNEIKVLSGITDNSQVTTEWYDLKF